MAVNDGYPQIPEPRHTARPVTDLGVVRSRCVANTDEGYTRLANVLLEAMTILALSGRQWRVLMAVMRKTYGYHKKFDWLTASQIAEAMSYDGALTHIRHDIRILKARRILAMDGRAIGINPVVSEWQIRAEVKPVADQKQPVKPASPKTDCPKTARQKSVRGQTEIGSRGDRNPSKKQTGVSPHKRKKDNYSKDNYSKDTLVAEIDDSATVVVDEKPISPVQDIFAHWQIRMNHPHAKLDDKRRALIQKALKTGYSTDQLKAAIDGCAKTPHNMGFNDRQQVYDGLHIILRSADQIDRFIANNDRPLPSVDSPPRSSKRLHDVTDTRWAYANFGEEHDAGDER